MAACVLLRFIFYREVNGKLKHEPNPSRKERPQKRGGGGGGGGGRYEPYGNVHKRYRVFVSNIPYDVKWQALKDLMKEKGKAQNEIDCKFTTRWSIWCDRCSFEQLLGISIRVEVVQRY